MPDELLVLGSSAGIVSRERFATAYALRVAGKLFLLDCGAPVSNLLYRYGFDPLDVQAVFLSHWHMDHIAGLGLFLAQNHLRQRPGPLMVYGPAGSRGKIKRLLTDSFLLPDELSYPLHIINIKSQTKYKEALLEVTYFRTRHLERTRYKTHFGDKAVSYGMIVNGPGWRLVYSGDLRSSIELAPYVSGCDLLIHELTHPSLKEVVDFIENSPVPHLLLSHIAPDYDETPDKIGQAFAGHFSGQLTIAQDGTKVQLSPTLS
ncbi:MAG: MBL fold metallo-hydrolase [Chloroflexota bacterium]